MATGGFCRRSAHWQEMARLDRQVVSHSQRADAPRGHRPPWVLRPRIFELRSVPCLRYRRSHHVSHQNSFNVATGALVKTLPGHQEIVYDMQWGLETEDSEFETAATGEDHSAVEGSPGPLLLTASADTTAKVWSLASAAVTATCHHPSYCYAARFCAGPDGVRGDTDSERAMSGCQYVVTGCYDTHLRLWDVRADSVGESGAAQIVKLISGHSSHVNSLAMDGDVTKLLQRGRCRADSCVVARETRF